MTDTFKAKKIKFIEKVHMGDSAQGGKNMQLMVQDLLCHSDKTTVSNFMVDVSI